MSEHLSRTEEIRKRVKEVVSAIKCTMGTSLGPKGMDKMITQGTSTTITNDGSTILKMMKMQHPVAQLVCNISHSQDEQSGDGTTSITLLVCSLVERALELIAQKIHPVLIADAMEVAKAVCKDALERSAESAEGEANLRHCIKISLNSKIVNAYIEKITDVTVQAIKYNTEGSKGGLCMGSIRRIKVKGNMEDTQMVPGVVLSVPLKTRSKLVPRKMKVAILQCTLSQTKPNLDAKITVSTYEAMAAVAKEEKMHILALCKQIKEKGIDLVILQKSIIRASLSELALHFLERLGVLVVDDVDRKEAELCVEQLGITPVVDVFDIKETMIASLDVEELEGYVKLSAKPGVCTVVLRGTDDIILEEVDRSFNDAINVGRLVVSNPKITYGGGVPELVCYTALSRYTCTKSPKTAYCIRELAKALLVIPEMLAVNTGASSISTVESLIHLHSASTNSTYGVSIKELREGDMKKEHVIQPLGVALSGLSGAFDGASVIIRIDDLVVM
ncbi:T-complex protein 1 subunit delta [Nematocida sp. AWRm77]|nr:T-complex protein 1 subunit delta [Nematocida sp. AWRm77]